MAKPYTTDTFLKELFEKNSHYRNGEFKVIGQYIDSKSKIECECPVHGVWNTTTPNDLLSKNRSCPKCGKEKRAKNLAKTKEQFLEELYKKNEHYRNGGFKVLGEYVNAHTPIECECPIHGVWSTTRPHELLKGTFGCPHCNTRRKIDHNEFLKRLYERNEHYRNGEFKVIGKYTGDDNTVECECPIHDIWNSTKASSLLTGTYCPKCSGYKKTTESFLKELMEKNSHYQNGEFEVIGKYITATNPIVCKCPIHGEWNTSSPNTLLNMNVGCPKCNNLGTSFPENLIRCALQQALPDANIPNSGDRKTLGGKEIDIPVYKYNFAIEYGAWFWHKDKWKDDYQKYLSLKESNIKLFTIYDSFDGSVAFPEDFNPICFEKNLSAENEYSSLKELIYKMIKDINHKEISWEKAFKDAKKLTRTVSTEMFCQKLYEKNTHYRNGEFEIVGNYVNAHTVIACECPVHGIWNTSRPNGLLTQNSGCPICASASKRRGDINDEKIMELLRMGYSKHKIAKMLNCSSSTIYYRCSKLVSDSNK